jgi:hypothetical protein
MERILAFFKEQQVKQFDALLTELFLANHEEFVEINNIFPV